MNTAVRFLILTFVLVGVYLFVRNSVTYKIILGNLSSWFARAYSALVEGKTQ